MSQSSEMPTVMVKRNGRWETIQAVSQVLGGIGMVAMPIIMVFLAVILVRITNDRECENRLTADMREAIGLGLVAVAEDDTEELQAQADILVEIARAEC